MQNKKYRPLAKNTLLFFRRHYRKRKISGSPQNSPSVYLCRHRDMIGVVQAFSDIKTVLRPWVLNCFCTYKDAKRQFRDYTFSVRMKKSKLFCKLMSPICARIITMYAKSVRAIPVYRKENASKSITTIKQSVKALEEDYSIVIFVDVDYINDQDCNDGEIYKGFYAIDKLYFKRNKKHIPFVPVYANEAQTVIHSPVYFTSDERQSVFDEIVKKIYNPE